MSENIDAAAFKAELEALCEKYGVTLTTSMYDLIQVWRKQPGFELVDWDDDWDKTE